MKGKSVFDSRLVSTTIFFSLLLLVFAIWLWLPTFLAKDMSLNESGLSGDSYGSVNALFTGLAFAGLVFTVLLQQREIKLQRDDFFSQIEEMSLTRAEVARQTAIQEKQIALGFAELKFKKLQAEISYLELESTKWADHAKIERVGPKLEKVLEEMEIIIKEHNPDIL